MGLYLDGHRRGQEIQLRSGSGLLKTKDDSDRLSRDLKYQDVKRAVDGFVLTKLRDVTAASRKQKKLQTLQYNGSLLGELPRISQRAVSHFIDEVQEKCPGMSDRDLQRVVEILANLEESRYQYDLLKRLAQCSPDDLDTWNQIMQQWTASSAEIVLSELSRRLRLIDRMRMLADDTKADELHELQPLFERGLWIFGTEYEAVDFRSNRGLREVILNFLAKKTGLDGNLDYKPPIRRTDIVAAATPSIGVYSGDAFDKGKVVGIRKVLVLELKKGGYALERFDVNQARDYAIEIRKSGRVQDQTELEVYLLGASCGDFVGVMAEPTLMWSLDQ